MIINKLHGLLLLSGLICSTTETFTSTAHQQRNNSPVQRTTAELNGIRANITNSQHNAVRPQQEGANNVTTIYLGQNVQLTPQKDGCSYSCTSRRAHQDKK